MNGIKRRRGRKADAQHQALSTQPRGGQERERTVAKVKANGTSAPTAPAAREWAQGGLRVRRTGNGSASENGNGNGNGNGNIRAGLEIEGPLVSGTGTATIKCTSNSSLRALRTAIEDILEERVQTGEIAAEGCLAPDAWGGESREGQVRSERSRSSTGSRERMRSWTHSGRSSG